MTSRPVAMTGAAALLGTDLDRIDDAVVTIQGGVITGAGPREAVTDESCEVVDARGLLLVPGFIDAHVHIGFAEPSDVLRGGVTTVRDLGWPPEVIFPLSSRSREVDFPGPAIYAAGPILTAPGGYPTRATWAPPATGLVVGSPDEARDAVGGLRDRGAAVVKVALNPPAGPTLDRATLQAIVDAAHERSLKVTGHVHGLDELAKAIETGMDELAHALMSPEEIPRDLLEAMVSRDMTVVPTLSIFSGDARDIAIDNVGRFRRAGGRVVYGTDLGNAGPRPGIDPSEVEAMSETGMSTEDIVRSATVTSADWLGLPSIGVIAAGRQADIVGVPIDALEDPRLLARPRMVLRRGRRAG